MKHLAMLLLTVTACIGAQSSPSAAPDTDSYKQAARSIFASEMKKQEHDCEGVEQQQPLNACMASAAQSTEASLNNFYAALRMTIGPPARTALRDAQKTWLLYRQQTCAAATDRYKGGSIAPFVHSSCQIRVTRERMRLLNELYSIGQQE